MNEDLARERVKNLANGIKSAVDNREASKEYSRAVSNFRKEENVRKEKGYANVRKGIFKLGDEKGAGKGKRSTRKIGLKSSYARPKFWG